MAEELKEEGENRKKGRTERQRERGRKEGGPRKNREEEIRGSWSKIKNDNQKSEGASTQTRENLKERPE